MHTHMHVRQSSMEYLWARVQKYISHKYFHPANETPVSTGSLDIIFQNHF